MSSPILGLDIGTRRTGVALSPNGIDVQPLTTITWEPPHAHKLASEISARIVQHGVETVVLGVPLGADGSATSQSVRQEKIHNLIKRELLAKHPALTLIEFNEFSSSLDGAVRFPHLDRDAAAASTILTSFIEHNA